MEVAGREMLEGQVMNVEGGGVGPGGRRRVGSANQH